MRKRLFGIGITLTFLGGAFFTGTLETDGNAIIPLVVFLIGFVLALTNLKGCEEIINEEENYKRRNSNRRIDDTRPKFLPR